MTPLPETQLALVVQKLDTMHEDMGDMKEAMKALSSAITKLALVEAQQITSAKAISKLEESVKDEFIAVNRDMAALKKQAPLNHWIQLGVAAMIGVAGSFWLGRLLVTAFGRAA